MNRIFLTVFLMLLAPFTFCDESVPAEKKLEKAKADVSCRLKIVDVASGKLQIPQNLIPELKTGKKSSMLDRTQTIAVGVALAFALALGGVSFARRRKAPGVLAMFALASLLVAGTATVALGDVPPPQPKDGFNVRVEVVPNDDALTISIPRAELEKLLASAKKAAKEAEKK